MKTKIKGIELEGTVDEMRELLFNTNKQDKEETKTTSSVLKSIPHKKLKQYASGKTVKMNGCNFRKGTIAIFKKIKMFLEENNTTAYNGTFLMKKFFGYQTGAKTNDMKAFFKTKKIYNFRRGQSLYFSATKTPTKYINNPKGVI